MPNSRGNQPVNSFVKGLITEVSPLSFPENASLDEINFKLKHDGSRERRLGIDYEEGYTAYNIGLSTAELPSATQSAFRWPNPNGSSKVDIGVIQIGRNIYFLNLLTAAPSSNLLNGGAGIDTGIDNDSPWQFAILNNYLLAVNPKLPQPYLVSYNDATDVISYETASIQIRDLYGVDDSLVVNNRPTTLSLLHKYNLRNQGWSSNIISTCGTDAIDCTFNTHGVYPSNSDQWGIGRIGDLTDANVFKYDPNLAKRNLVDGGQVPRGSMIIDLYNRGASRTNLTGCVVPMDRESTYISTVAGYAGRAWYSGIRGKIIDGDDRSPNLSNAVLYSQIFRNKEDLVKCYQEADPTSYQFNEVVDTDGGIIFITEASNIIRLVTIKSSLFVFAENGVWEIQGGQDGFTATVFQIKKVSNVGVYSPKSIVEVNGVVYFWGISGIYSITPNPQMVGVWDTTNITLDTIQRLFNSLPDVVKKGAKGYYDLNSNTARWLYTSDSPKITGNPIDILDPIPIIELGIISDVTTVSSFRIDVARMTDSLALVTYTDGTNNLRIRLLTITGVSVAVGSDQAPGITNALATTSVCRLDDTHALVTYLTSANNIGCRILTISGSTVTTGAETTFACKAGTISKVEAISSSQAIVCYHATTDKIAARILDVSGTTITAGAQVEISSATTVSQYNIDVVDSTHAIATYLDSTATRIKGRVIVITGSVLTVPGSETNISLAGVTTSTSTEVKMQTSTKGIVTWADAGSVMKSVVIGVSGTIITTNSTYSYTKTGSAFSSQFLSGGKYVLGYNLTTTNFPHMLVNSVGTSPTEGLDQQLNNETSFEFSVDGMTSNKVIIIYKAFSSAIIKSFVATV